MGTRRKQTPVPERVIDLVGVTVPEPVTAMLPEGLKGRAKGLRATRSPLGYVISQIPGGRRAVFQLLSLADDAEAEAIAAVWRGLSEQEQANTPLETICEQAEISPRDFIGLVSKVSYDFNVELGNTLAGFAYPKIMKASIDRAQRPKGEADRRIHLEKSGFAASKKGAFIQVNQNNQQNNIEREPEPGEPPPFERTARRVVRDISPRPQLPPGER